MSGLARQFIPCSRKGNSLKGKKFSAQVSKDNIRPRVPILLKLKRFQKLWYLRHLLGTSHPHGHCMTKILPIKALSTPMITTYFAYPDLSHCPNTLQYAVRPSMTEIYCHGCTGNLCLQDFHCIVSRRI